jgi:hypothetical protein
MKFPRRTLIGLALAKVGLAPARAALDPVQRPTASPEVWLRTELYFGTKRAGLPDVTKAQFDQFVTDFITPRFPDGLTRFMADGQFRNSRNELIMETSHVVILFYPPQMRGANAALEQIRQDYKDQYQQESVLRADSYNIISF